MQKRLITIFSLDGDNSVADLDIAILQAIVKGEPVQTCFKLFYLLHLVLFDIIVESLALDNNTFVSKQRTKDQRSNIYN